MLFEVGGNILEAVVFGGYQCFIIEGNVVELQYDDYSCFIVVKGSRLSVKHL